MVCVCVCSCAFVCCGVHLKLEALVRQRHERVLVELDGGQIDVADRVLYVADEEDMYDAALVRQR